MKRSRSEKFQWNDWESEKWAYQVLHKARLRSEMFQWNDWVRQNTQSEIVVYVNGDSVKYFGDYNTVGDYRQLNFFLAYELQKNDEVWLKNNYADSIYASIYHPTTFLGYLM